MHSRNNTYKLSVIVPCYNVESTVTKCVESIVSCDYGNLEVILVDDGSTDGTRKLIEEISNNYTNVFSFSKCNEGLGLTRNYGIHKASGELITFIDADDYIDKNAYSCMIDNMIDNESDVVFCGFRYVYSNNTREDVFNCKSIYSSNEFIEYMLTTDSPYCGVSACTGIYRKNKLLEMNDIFFSEREYLSEDKVFNFRYVSNIQKITVVDKAFYNYVQHCEGSITNTFKEYKIIAARNKCDYLLSVCIDENLKKEVLKSYLIDISACFMHLFVDDTVKVQDKKQYIPRLCSSINYGYLEKLDKRQLNLKFKIFRNCILNHNYFFIFMMFYINGFMYKNSRGF